MERESLSASDLRAHLTGRVAKFWIPEYWVFTDQIPKTSVGKLDKRQLRDVNERGDLNVKVVRD